MRDSIRDEIPHYPRTLHLEDSAGGRSKHSATWQDMPGKNIVIEEKIDGSHVGLFFDSEAELRIFHRNSFLALPPQRSEFRPLFRDCQLYMEELWQSLETRYVLYGEWAYLRHTIVYNSLPAYFLEDDIYDRQAQAFLSTSARRGVTKNLPQLFGHSVPILFQGEWEALCQDGPSLRELASQSEFQSSDLRDTGALPCEGLYIKCEDQHTVTGRYKWVLPEFLASIKNADTHWNSRRPERNLLRSLV